MKNLTTYLLIAACNGLSIAGRPSFKSQTVYSRFSRSEPDAITSQLDLLREAYNLPALAVSLTNSTSRSPYTAQTGVISLDNTSNPIHPNSPWPLGSNTKSMTATTIALLIQDDLLFWNTTLADVFSANGSFPLPLTTPLHASHANTTIAQLASHRSGLTGTFGIDQPPMFAGQMQELYDMPAAESRALAATTTLALPIPEGGEKGRFVYSNDNYILLGFIIDVLANKSAEEVIRERIWQPLGLESARWGSPLQDDSDKDMAGVPWPHLVDLSGNGSEIYAYKEDWSVRFRDLPPYMNTAGVAWMGVGNYQLWLRAQVDEDLWSGKLGLTEETIEEWLHRKADGEVDPKRGEYDYTYGAWVWSSDSSDCGDAGVCLSHIGSNTMYVDNAWVDTGRNVTAAAFTNAPLAGGGVTGTNMAIELLVNGSIVF